MKINPVQIAYVVMIAGMVFTYLFIKKNNRDLREGADEFAFAFIELTNYLMPERVKQGLSVRTDASGKLEPVRLENQSEMIRAIIERARTVKAEACYMKMYQASENIDQLTKRSKRNQTDFSDPIYQILVDTQTFLSHCEDLTTIRSKKEKKEFDSFLFGQVDYRMILLKRISGKRAEEYRKVNSKYIEEMSQIEKKEK
ncbi:hypothetical protein [Guggenheimella bovis]